MLEKSFGLCFFLKPSAMESNSRYLYLWVSVDGIRKEISTKRKWDPKRWDARFERATGTKEDARSFNHFIDTLVMKINQFKMDLDLMHTEKTITSQRIVDFLLGRVVSKALLLEEFQDHNDEMRALVPADYVLATYKRYHSGLERELNTHLARHTFATITLTNGVPIETVSKMLGHSSIRTTQVYAKVIEQKIDEDMNRLNGRLFNAMLFPDDQREAY
jgi:Phage integrase family/Arm DNA-binding domain